MGNEVHFMVDKNDEIHLVSSDDESWKLINMMDSHRMKKAEGPMKTSSSEHCIGVQFRGNSKAFIKAADDSHNSKQEPQRKLSSIMLATEDKERSVISARTFKSENPFCVVTMRRSYVRLHEKYNLNIAQDFANKYLKDFQGVTLRLSNRGMWHVQHYNTDPRKLSSSGWKAFVLANHIKEDDVCIFELVDKKHIELNVTIFNACPLELAA
ncbi:hypothetical protein FRX31_020687 [Thalictrum thalictroides]|uniref:TF-B3 domain-containing protein n=1 Tax=Thalictrum thalictroides TaxID=46969 RepID=A0A7J6VZU4_THATH|nr:hypothetical protein FRX31_020687 [Thalictrum thalictroides]